MLKSLLGKVRNVAVKTIGSIKEPLKRVGQFGVAAGKFALENHQYIAPLLHGVALASGNPVAQKITGGLLAVSNMAAVRQGLNQGNAKVAQAMQSNGGRAGVFNHMTGTLM